MLDPEFRARWIEALRSGNYKQTKSVLRRKEGGEYCYCCLGVACDLIDPNGWNGMIWSEKQSSFQLSSTVIPGHVRMEFGLLDMDQDRLIHMNDEGDSFEDIAKYIEENL